MTKNTKAFKDPETKKSLSMYKACKDGDLETLKRIYEIKKDVKIFDEYIGSNKPFIWALRFGHFDMLQFLISLNVTAEIDDFTLKKYWKFDKATGFKNLPMLLSIPEIDLLTNLHWVNTPTGFVKSAFIQIMKHPYTKKLYDDKDYGMLSKYYNNVSNLDNTIQYCVRESIQFWCSLLRVNDDLFQVMEELGYSFNCYNIMRTISDVSKTHYYASSSFGEGGTPIKKKMLDSMFTRIQDHTKDEIHELMHLMLHSYWVGQINIKPLLKLYGKKYDFNKKYKQYLVITNSYEDISFFELLVLKHDIDILKDLVKIQPEIKSKRLIKMIYNGNYANFYKGDYSEGYYRRKYKNPYNVFKFLKDNYPEELFDDNDKNWDFKISHFRYDDRKVGTLNSIKNIFDMILSSCTHHKFIQEFIYYHLYNSTKYEDDFIIFKPYILSAVESDKEDKYLEPIIIDYLKRVMKYCYDQVKILNDNYYNKYSLSFLDNYVYFYNKTIHLVKIYKEAGYLFRTEFLNNPIWEKVADLVDKICKQKEFRLGKSVEEFNKLVIESNLVIETDETSIGPDNSALPMKKTPNVVLAIKENIVDETDEEDIVLI